MFRLARGRYDPIEGARFAEFMMRIVLPEDAPVSCRLVQSLWTIPHYLLLQQTIVLVRGGNMKEYEKLMCGVIVSVEELLGCPPVPSISPGRIRADA